MAVDYRRQKETKAVQPLVVDRRNRVFLEQDEFQSVMFTAVGWTFCCQVVAEVFKSAAPKMRKLSDFSGQLCFRSYL